MPLSRHQIINCICGKLLAIFCCPGSDSRKVQGGGLFGTEDSVDRLVRHPVLSEKRDRLQISSQEHAKRIWTPYVRHLFRSQLG